jgi:nucleoside 2-deoxyribosyltransferase
VKPTIFVGSSSETLDVAEALFGRLKDVAATQLWDNHAIFTPSESTLQSLINAVGRFDFAVFVLGPDDITISRNREATSPRDNVVFEIGLFMGAIGPARTFLVYDGEDRPKLPSDLAGITTLSYPKSGYADPSTAVVEVASVIKARVRELGAVKRPRQPVIYWCGPHDDRFNATAKLALERYAFDVRMPDDLVGRLDPSLTPAGRSSTIRKICCDAINDSDVVVVNLDTYGLDSAWEMGYAEALGKPIVGHNRSDELIDPTRVVNKRLFIDNYMHGWDTHFTSADLDEIASRCAGKVVYLFCPYKNEVAIDAVCNSSVGRESERIIVSNRDLGIDPTNSTTYSWRVRKRAMQFVSECEVILAVLPRYGMDTAWKLGYGAALHKEVVGWIANDFGSERSEADFLDHWMHGWRKKPVVGSMADLATYVRGVAAQ